MGVNITNDNIDEFLTSYIDGQIHDPDTDKQLKSIIESNELISKKYRTELLTRNLFRSRLASIELPASTTVKVNNSINGLIKSAAGKHTAVSDKNTADIFSEGFFEYFRRLISAPFAVRNVAVPRYAFAVILIFAIIGTGLLMKKSNADLNPYISAGSEKSVLVQAMKNFHKVLTGDIKPEMKSDDKNHVKDFVMSEANFEAYVPDISDYVLEGAACDEYRGQKLAHLVYKSGREIIYIYEIQVNSLHCKELEIPEPVHYDILKDKFYMCDKVDANDDCTMIVWYKDNVLCTSVSTMPKQRMISSFTSFK
jgi:hypothetical protein